MDSSQQLLAIESFSYSWLIDLKPSLDITDDVYDGECFIEMDPKISRFQNVSEIQDFNFDCAVAQPLALVDADEIFADGLLVPLHLIATSTMHRPSLDGCSSASEPTDYSPVSSAESSTVSLLSTTPPPFLRRCRRYSRRIFLTCAGFLRPFCCRLRRRRTGRGMMSGRRRATRSGCAESLPTNPRMSTSSSASDWGHAHVMLASDVERSISEAVLHCKRSNNGEFGL